MLVNMEWWNDDRILSVVSLIFGIFSFWLTVRISRIQNKQQKMFSEKVLGTIPNVDSFRMSLCELLKKAEKDSDSHVYLMLYWLWLGADRLYPKYDINSLNESCSDVMKLLKVRTAKGLKTTIVVYDHAVSKSKLIDFFHAIFRYNSENLYKESGIPRKSVKHDDVMMLYSRYRDSLNNLRRDASQYQHIITIKEAEDIPILMGAVSGKEPSALLLLFEKTAIKGMASSGGFQSNEPRMVDIIKNQIEISAKSSRDNED